MSSFEKDYRLQHYKLTRIFDKRIQEQYYTRSFPFVLLSSFSGIQRNEEGVKTAKHECSTAKKKWSNAKNTSAKPNSNIKLAVTESLVFFLPPLFSTPFFLATSRLSFFTLLFPILESVSLAKNVFYSGISSSSEKKQTIHPWKE